MLSVVALLPAFSPKCTPGPVSRAAVRSSCSMSEETSTRRDLFAKAGAALLGASFVEGASAKAGQFGKINIFGYDASSPYVPGGPKSGPEATFGYSKTEGEFLATGYEKDVAREKAAFVESSKRISSLQPKIDSKTWWFIRDELRIQAYNMRSSMVAMNGVLSADTKSKAEKAYKKYWTEVESFDFACKSKEPALAQKEYDDVLAALKAYTALAL